jgi:hypothetical protein
MGNGWRRRRRRRRVGDHGVDVGTECNEARVDDPMRRRDGRRERVEGNRRG